MGLVSCVVFAFLTLTCLTVTAKHDYRIELKKAEIKELNTVYLSDKSQLGTAMYNDSVTVLDGKLIFAKHLSAYLHIDLSGYQLSSTGEWVKNFNQFTYFCSFLNHNFELFENIFPAVDFTAPCPPDEGIEWAFSKDVIDVSPFPESVDAGQWKINARVTTGTPLVIDLDIYADIVKIGV